MSSPISRAAALVTLVIAATGGGCGDENNPAEFGRRAATDLATDLEKAVVASEQLLEPFRCAVLDDTGVAELELGSIAGRRVVQTGQTVKLDPPSSKASRSQLVLGVISDARGSGAQTMAAMGRFRAAFEKAGVEVVVLLGGMARGADGLTQHLELFSAEDRWPVLLIPGGREEIQAMRAAIREVGAGTARVIDGSEVRLLIADGVALATFPGVGYPERSVAGALGCTHDGEDANALADKLRERSEIKVWLTHPPPRLNRNGATDVAIGGVHVGESLQAAAIASSGAQVVIHGAIDEAAFGPESGVEVLGKEPVIVGVGSADALPVTDETGRTLRSVATIVTVGKRRVGWKRIFGQ